MLNYCFKVTDRSWLRLIKSQMLIAGLSWEVNPDLLHESQTCYTPTNLTSTPLLSTSLHKLLTVLVLSAGTECKSWGVESSNMDLILRDSGLMEHDRWTALYINVETHECIRSSTHTHISLCISLLPTPTQVGTAQPQQEGDGFDGRASLWSLLCGPERLEWGQRLSTPMLPRITAPRACWEVGEMPCPAAPQAW